MQASILIVTGYSGAGKTTVLKALEDIGFFCVDNLPLALLPAFFDYIAKDPHAPAHVALGLDVRSSTNTDELIRLFDGQADDKLKILFLSATTPELIKRFQETRRRHPLAQSVSLVDAIEQEKALLQPIANIAELVVDTGNFTMHQLRHFVRTAFCQGEQPLMIVSLISFGFRYGTPQECNYVYDLRSLPNPHFVPELRHKSGLDEDVRNYLFSQPAAQEYWHRMRDFVLYSIQKSLEEGRSFIHIAIGCTGGQHRSVAFVEELAKETIAGVTFIINHKSLALKQGNIGENPQKNSSSHLLRI
jgi:UPF0042 nucleotide-binding protein